MDGVFQFSHTHQDPEVAAAALGQLYGHAHLEAPADQAFTATCTASFAGPVSLQRLHLSGAPATFRVDAPDYLKIGQLLGGHLPIEAGTTVTAAGALPFLFPRQPYAGSSEAFELESVVLEAAAVEDHARQLLDDDKLNLRFTGHIPVNTTAARYWTATAAHLRDGVLANEEAINLPLIRAEAFRAVTTALLHCFPNTFQDRFSNQPDPATTPAAVRRATAFIQDNLHQSIGLADIAQAARLSPHGLLAAFRRHLQSTPMEHLRNARLDAIRTELLKTDPTDGITIETVALRFGLTDLHRFTTQYKEQHGETPDSTLNT